MKLSKFQFHGNYPVFYPAEVATLAEQGYRVYSMCLLGYGPLVCCAMRAMRLAALFEGKRYEHHL
jgi:hypothetical protein